MDMIYNVMIDTQLIIFLVFSLLMMGFIAFLSGKAIAENWKHPLFMVCNSLLLSAANRFFIYALFEGVLLDAQAFFAHSILYFLIMFLSYRFMRSKKMATQYPWLYRRYCLFWWVKKRQSRNLRNGKRRIGL